MVLLEARGFTRDHYARFHPGGTLGQRLRLRVRDLMRSGDLLPRVEAHATLRDALEEMTRRDNLGVTVVTDSGGRLAGIITDGDLRRILFRGPESVVSLLQRPVGELMSRDPKSIEGEVP